MKKVSFLSIPIDAMTMDETIVFIEESIRCNNKINHVGVNASKIVDMQTDKVLYNSVLSCNMISPDGMSVIWASKLLGKPITERVTGIDMMERLVELAYKKGYRCYFFGTKENIVKKLVDIYKEQYSDELIAGYRNGYYSEDEEESIAIEIGHSGADLLFVAMTSPKKEIFLDKYSNHLASIKFTMGVGGSFDVLSGNIKRAPLFIQRCGLEWFYRLIQEPRRMWKRYTIDSIKFMILVLKDKMK